ncbi:unnamed protein product [Clavelina lepadiformis]|uniref:Uncharacterized protein n=1 Tax=Clavelina lepadiformis TaxID=159417 RepID=A0ABP0G6W5_CLALP
MAVFVAGLVAVIIFYLVVLIVGIWAAWRNRLRGSQQEQNERIMVGGRDIGIIVGSFTFTGTFVGGGYINGTAESLYSPEYGLLWTHAPLGSFLCVIVGGLFFAKKMRAQGYTTMLDPFQCKFGKRMGGLLFLPALCGDLFWSASVLAALGGTLSVVIDLDIRISVIVSACIAILYTLIGGLYSVAYTDVVQTLCIFFGLWFCVPFAFVNPAVLDAGEEFARNNTRSWLGTCNPENIGALLDSLLLVVFGSLPWQDYFQRVLSTDSPKHAQVVSFISAFGILILAIPPALIGAVAINADWNMTGYGDVSPLEKGESALILPIVLRYLTPPAVSVIGLGAIAAAVMSSIDSSILSASSLFTRNVYKLAIRQQASQKELTWVMRITLFFVGALSTTFALAVGSVYKLWYLASDIVYVVIFPQLVCVLYFDVNTYGSFLAYLLAIILRLGGGEPVFNLEPFIHYPGGTNFPFKTFSMLMSLVTLIAVSYAVKFLFVNGILAKKYDFLGCKLAEEGRTIHIKEIDKIGYNAEKEKLHG